MPDIFNNMTTPSAPLRDIFRYAPYSGSVQHNPYRMANNSDMDDGAFYGSMPGMDTFERFHDQAPGTEDYEYSRGWRIRPDSWLAGLSSQYEGFNPTMSQVPGAQDKQWQMEADWSKLPKTKFGSVADVIPVDNMKDVADPRLVYDDPVYGKITHRLNRKRDWKSMVPSIAVQSMIGGMAGMMGPAMFMGLNPAQLLGGLSKGLAGGLDGGGLGSFLPMLLRMGTSFIPGGDGISSLAKPLISAAMMQALQRRGRG